MAPYHRRRGSEPGRQVDSARIRELAMQDFEDWIAATFPRGIQEGLKMVFWRAWAGMWKTYRND